MLTTKKIIRTPNPLILADSGERCLLSNLLIFISAFSVVESQPKWYVLTSLFFFCSLTSKGFLDLHIINEFLALLRYLLLTQSTNMHLELCFKIHKFSLC